MRAALHAHTAACQQSEPIPKASPQRAAHCGHVHPRSTCTSVWEASAQRLRSRSWHAGALARTCLHGQGSVGGLHGPVQRPLAAHTPSVASVGPPCGAPLRHLPPVSASACMRLVCSAPHAHVELPEPSLPAHMWPGRTDACGHAEAFALAWACNSLGMMHGDGAATAHGSAC